MSKQFQDDSHPWPERAYPSLTRECCTKEAVASSVDPAIVAPDGVVSQKPRPESVQAAEIKPSASRTSSDWAVEGKCVRPRFRGLVGILLLALEDPWI